MMWSINGTEFIVSSFQKFDISPSIPPDSYWRQTVELKG
jgi:hypothetical protein